MIWLKAKTMRRIGRYLALAGLTSAACGRVLAGDQIVFGAEKAKFDPGKERAPAPNPFRFEQLSRPRPFDLDGISPPILPRTSSNPKREKRQQNAEDEKRNWMFFEEGELQDKEDAKSFLGIRDQETEDFGSSKDGHDYTFRETSSSSARTPAQLRPPTQPAAHSPGHPHTSDPREKPAQVRRENPDEQEPKRESRSSAILFGKGDASPSGRADKDFELKNSFDSKRSERALGKSEFSLRDFLGTGEPPVQTREEHTRLENFRQMLISPSDPANSSSDLTRQTPNPVVPYSLGESRPSAGPNSFGGDYLAPRQSLLPPGGSPLNFLSSPDINSHPSGLGPASPAPGWRATPVELPRPKF